MGKLSIAWMVLTLFVMAEKAPASTALFQQQCLNCHQKQQIPNTLIYKRYLMRYSTRKRMEEAMFAYLKDPKKEYSIMPAPFFLKFPMKKGLGQDDDKLLKNIREYLDTYDIKKKLILEKCS